MAREGKLQEILNHGEKQERSGKNKKSDFSSKTSVVPASRIEGHR
jgi:hypothetical protein